MNYLSLFSGIGGFELGFYFAHLALGHQDPLQNDPAHEKANVKRQRLKSLQKQRLPTTEQPLLRDWQDYSQPPHCVGYSEIDRYAISIYENHFNHTNFGDVQGLKASELPQFDLLVAGFPCQSFSIAGKRRGFADTRGTLFFEISRILRAKRPRLCLLVNVKGLLSHDQGRTFRAIVTTLDELGYDLQWQVLNSKDFAVPQNRERVFIVGHRRGTPRPEIFPLEGYHPKMLLLNRKKMRKGLGFRVSLHDMDNGGSVRDISQLALAGRMTNFFRRRNAGTRNRYVRIEDSPSAGSRRLNVSGSKDFPMGGPMA